MQAAIQVFNYIKCLDEVLNIIGVSFEVGGVVSITREDSRRKTKVDLSKITRPACFEKRMRRRMRTRRRKRRQ